MMRECGIDFNGSSDDHLPLIEFCYNNSYHSNIWLGPFKAFYGKRCRSLVVSFEVGESSILFPQIIHDAM